jgi:hypothetical protein
MTEPFDLSKLFVDPKTFSATADKNSMIADETATEIFVGPVPPAFNVDRACEHFDKLLKEKNHGHMGYVFLLPHERNGKVTLVVAFTGAVDFKDTAENLTEVVDREIDTINDRQKYPYALIPASNNMYPVILANYPNAAR